MKKKSDIKIKQTMDADGVSRLLADIVNSLKNGTICIERGEEFTTLVTGTEIEAEIEASQKKDKQKLSISLSWRLHSLKEEEGESFRISSAEPEITDPSPLEEEGKEEG